MRASEVGTELDEERPGSWDPRRLTCATWLASRSIVTEFDCFEPEGIGGETPNSRRALGLWSLQGLTPGAMISARYSQTQSLRSFIVLELEHQGR